MSKQALAVKYRPKRFNDVIEQDVTKAILCEQLKNKTFKNCLLFCGGAGTGKAQPLTSKVLTPKGFIPMKKVKIGTEVITGNAKVAKVSEIYPQGKRDVYRITLSNDDKIEVSDEHINVVYKEVDGAFVESNILTIDLLKEDYTNLFMRKITPQLGVNAYYSISDIKLLGKKKCQCIFVDAPEHTYITDNHIVTHNTTSARIFANEINEFKGKHFEFRGTEKSKSADQIFVNTQVPMQEGEPASVKWRVKDTNGKMQIIDIIIENVSLAQTARSEYTSYIQKSPNGIDGLIKDLKAKLK